MRIDENARVSAESWPLLAVLGGGLAGWKGQRTATPAGLLRPVIVASGASLSVPIGFAAYMVMVAALAFAT